MSENQKIKDLPGPVLALAALGLAAVYFAVNALCWWAAHRFAWWSYSLIAVGAVALRHLVHGIRQDARERRKVKRRAARS